MKVLVISVHPDDETLGCGGTILKHSQNQDEIFWLIMTKPLESIGYSTEFIIKRKLQITNATKQYQFRDVFELNMITTKLHLVDFSEIIQKLSSIINKIKPEVLYMVNRSDIHTDHQVAAKAILSSTKSFNSSFIKKILMYECLSETEIAPPFTENIFLPNSYSNITEFIEKKIEIIKIYDNELQEFPFPRSENSIRALNRFRGSTVGVEYAEAFMLVRELF